MNACFKHSYFPEKLLKGEILPIIKNKKDSASQSNNYRPIMQSSCLLKLFEIHLLNYLSEKIHFNNAQFGYCKNLSTTHTCFLLKEIINNYKRGKGKLFATFIDLSKAFDRVDHSILISKLKARDIPNDIVKLISCYLNEQTACIKWKNSNSKFKPINVGVRQGGILSPFLFKLYIDDVLKDISKLNEGCKLGLNRINVIAYADDIVLLTNSLDSLNNIFSLLKLKLDNLKLIINYNKTKCMVFSSRDKQLLNEVVFDGKSIEVVNEYKYLGNYITTNLDDKRDIELKLNNFYSSFYSIIRNFPNVNLNTFMVLFNSFCVPFYGLALWNNNNLFSKQIFKVFEKAYCGAIKQMLKVPKYTSNHKIAELCNIFLFKHLVNIIQLKFFVQIHNVPNTIFTLNNFFFKNGLFCGHVFESFNTLYNVNIQNNDFRALIARVSFIQKNEVNCCNL